MNAIVKLQEAGRFKRISSTIIPEDTLLMSNKDYESFESRTSTLNNIHGALKNTSTCLGFIEWAASERRL